MLSCESLLAPKADISVVHRCSKFLIMLGLDINDPDEDGDTPLINSLFSGNVELGTVLSRCVPAYLAYFVGQQCF
jgi:hypothetical protein